MVFLTNNGGVPEQCRIELSSFLNYFGRGINGHFPTAHNHDGIAIFCLGKSVQKSVTTNGRQSLDFSRYQVFKKCFFMMKDPIKITLPSKYFKIGYHII